MSVPVIDRHFQYIIPTHMRPDVQKTLTEMPPEIQQRTLIVTSTVEDRKEIRRNYRELIDPGQVYAIDDPQINSISKKRQWIVENVKAVNLFQIDDDVSFQVRCPRKWRMWVDDSGNEIPYDKNGCWKLRPERIATGAQLLAKKYWVEHEGLLLKHFLKFEELAEEYRHFGLSSRMLNDKVLGPVKTVTRAMHLIGHHRKTLLKEGIRFDAVRFREDFHVTLALLSRGYPNAQYYEMCGSPKPYDGKGGVSTERTVEASNADAKRLAKMYAPHVRLVEKNYEFSVPRIEVQVSWQRCYEAGLARIKDDAKKSIF